MALPLTLVKDREPIMQLKSFYRISILFSEAVAEGSLKAGKAMRIAIVARF